MVDRRSDMRIWQNKLYNLQCEAPKPIPVICTRPLQNRPEQYGDAYHGPLSRQAAEELFEGYPSGAYLVRDCQKADGTFTLAIRFDGVTKNYKLYYDEKSHLHYVGEKKFDSIDLLVADGLIYFYIETRGADVLQKLSEASNYEFSPYYQTRYHTINSQSHSPKPAAQASIGGTTENYPDATPLAALSCLSISKHSRFGASKSQTVVANRRQSVDIDLYRSQSESNHNHHQPFLSPARHPLQHSADDAGKQLLLTRDSALPPSTYTDTDEVSQKSFISDAFSNTDLSVRALTPTATSERCLTDAFIGLDNSSQPLANNIVSPSKMTAPASVNKETRQNEIGKTEAAVTCKEGSETGDYVNVSATRQPEENHTRSSRSCVNASDPESHRALAATLPAGTFDGNLQLNGTSSSSPSTGRRTPLTTAVVPDAAVPRSAALKSATSITFQRSRRFQRQQFEPRQSSPFSETGGLAEKAHNFRVHTFRGPHWCYFCTHFIWGLVSQGVKCTDCGFQAHKRCSIRVPNDCLPHMKQLKRVFCVELTSLACAEHRTVPLVLEKCITELERRGGLNFEGVFRVPGSHEVVEAFRIALDKDCEGVDLSEKRCPDPNTITSLIKSFLRQLPIPLITYETYPEFIEAVRNDELSEEERLHLLRETIQRLPPAHYHSLRYLMGHLNRVAQNHRMNMMTSENLAIVFTPSLMSSSFTDPTSCLEGAKFEQAVVERMISDYARLFEDSPTTTTSSSPSPSTTGTHSPSGDLVDLQRSPQLLQDPRPASPARRSSAVAQNS
ncbi:hypothetical protein AAHC03_09950 [Spirometra sp. Aus1]